MKNQRIFILDRDRNSASFLQYRLGAKGFRISIFKRVEDFFSRLHVDQPCCVIMDTFSPDIQDSDLISRIRDSLPEAAVVYFSSDGDERIYHQALESGVTDFILKGHDLSGVKELLSNLHFILSETTIR